MPRRAVRAEELGAFAIVRRVLTEARVEPYDDGSKDGMVDALIHYADRTAALEVVMDVNKATRSTLAAIEKHRAWTLDAPELRYHWTIQVGDGARISAIQRDVAVVLAAIEEAYPPPGLPPMLGRLANRGGDDALSRWGVLSATPAMDAAPGTVSLIQVNAGAGGTPEDLARWIGPFLSEQAPDVPRKLGAAGYGEAHAFIWLTESSDHLVSHALDPAETGLPTEAPTLPPKITHLWVGGFLRGWRVLRWQRAHAWDEVYRIPLDGEIREA